MDNKLLLIILSIFLPPVAVFLKAGVGKDLIGRFTGTYSHRCYFLKGITILAK